MDALERFQTTDVVRKALPGDDVEICRLYCLMVSYESNHILSREEIHRVVGSVDKWLANPMIEIFVLERYGRLIGQVICSVTEDVLGISEPAMSVWGLFVDPADSGIGTAIPLIRECIDRARELGIGTCEMDVVAGKNPGFYERIGCVPRETVYVYEVKR